VDLPSGSSVQGGQGEKGGPSFSWEVAEAC